MPKSSIPSSQSQKEREVPEDSNRGRYPMSRRRRATKSYAPSRDDYKFREGQPVRIDFDPNLPSDPGVRLAAPSRTILQVATASRPRRVPRQGRNKAADAELDRKYTGEASSNRRAPPTGELRHDDRALGSQLTSFDHEARDVERLGRILFKAALAAGDASSSSSSSGDEDTEDGGLNALMIQQQHEFDATWKPEIEEASASQSARQANPEPVRLPKSRSIPIKGQEKLDQQRRRFE